MVSSFLNTVNFDVDTDLLEAQSNPYRRMSANLYTTASPGEYYHIHGSLEASETLQMIGLPSHRPDLVTHDDIVAVIEPAVSKLTVDQLEALNAKHRQAGVKAFPHDEFLETPHVQLPLSLSHVSKAFAHCLRRLGTSHE